MRARAIVGLLLVTSSCASLSRLRPSLRCSDAPPADAIAFTTDRADSLAGRFSLIEVITSWAEPGGPPLTSELELHRPDTALVEKMIAERWIGRPKDLRLVGSARWSKEYPPEEAELDAGSLNIGCLGHCLDGSATQLLITAISPRGFWGTWVEHQGIVRNVGKDGKILPPPAGYFCATRR